MTEEKVETQVDESVDVNECENQESNPEIEEVVEEINLLEQKEKELSEEKDKYLRLHADFDNFRKRVQKEKNEWVMYASQGLLEKLLPVIDNLDRALGSLDQENNDIKGLVSGVEMIHKQLMDTLKQEGLERIEAVGQEFDPFLHEAMMQVPAEEDQEDNQIVEELRKGYKFKDRVIRPTMVKVAQKN